MTIPELRKLLSKAIVRNRADAKRDRKKVIASLKEGKASLALNQEWFVERSEQAAGLYEGILEELR